MKLSRPGVLAVRAVNQYRAREVMAYLGLRYYFDNAAARTDEWAREVAPHLVITRTNLPYFRAHHFKETDDSGAILHRPIFTPSPNEAIAEAALLAECAKHPEVFGGLKDTVFSYRLTTGDDRSGMYQNYFIGLKERHAAIAEACRANPDGLVRYTDIRRFYPSITTDSAREVWLKHAERANLDNQFIELGERLIHDHGQVKQPIDGKPTKGRILTGPMISHLIGNLMLRELDQQLPKELSVRYLRYVDDVTLIGDEDAVSKAVITLHGNLEGMGFELHPESSDKDIKVSAIDWLAGEETFGSGDLLAVKIKNYLFIRPQDREELERAFRGEGYRIPLKDYSVAALEASRVGWFRGWASRTWFRKKVSVLSTSMLMLKASVYRQVYQKAFDDLAPQVAAKKGYARKRAITKLRYLSSRLMYLAREENLPRIAEALSVIPESHLHAKVIEAEATRRIDHVLDLGTNAAQISAQILRAGGKTCSFECADLSEAKSQALAVFYLNGVDVNGSLQTEERDELLRFARQGSDAGLMRSDDPFLREIACLHGKTDTPRHAEMLGTAFDKDEDLSFYALLALGASGCY